jgi:hypothetical protein
MPFPYEIYDSDRAQLIDIFAEVHQMIESDLDNPHGFYLQPENHEADFFVLQSCIINNFSKEKTELTLSALEDYMHQLGAEKLLVPVVADDENNQWAIVVYEIPNNLTYYNLNANFSPEQISAAFCDVMSCHADAFFTANENYQVITIGTPGQEDDPAMLIWAALKGLINNSLNPDNPFINTPAAKAELEAYQEDSDTQIAMLLQPAPLQDDEVMFEPMDEVPPPPATFLYLR